MGKLDGRVAIVTGGGRGQGRSHAVHLAREGADVVVCGLDHQLDFVRYPLYAGNDLEETKELVEREGQRCVAVPADVSDYDQMQAVVETAVGEFGHVDIMCANAGFFVAAPVHETTLEEWNGSLGTHLTGVFHALKAVAPHFIAQHFGRFIATASIFGKQGAANCAAYVAAKWGVIGLIKTAAIELGPYGVTCNALCPGMTDTLAWSNDLVPGLLFPDDPNADMGMVDEYVKQNWHTLPVARIPVEDQSKAVIFLASDEGRFVSGSMLDVSAGMSARVTT